MERTIEFRPAAREDMADGYEWYEQRREGLGEAFLLEVNRCLKYILNSPGGFQRVHRSFRQAPIERFPYVIIYHASRDLIVIMRVFHCRRDPKGKFKKGRS